MAGKKKDYSEMSRSDLEKAIIGDKGIHKMKHEDRHTHTVEIMKGYNSGERDAEYNATFEVLKFGKKRGEMDKLYKGVHDQHQKKRSDLEDTVVTGWMKKFADKMMPALKMGTDDNQQQNYTTLMVYLHDYDNINKMMGKKSNVEAEVRAAIRKGDGHKASGIILNALEFVHRHNDLQDFMRLLLPGDESHDEFKEYAAKAIAKDAQKHLSPEEKKKYKIGYATISENLVTMYQHYRDKNYQEIIDASKVQKGKPKK